MNELGFISNQKVSYQLTKNQSFLKMHKYLKDNGIKNNKFFLALFDTDLQNVDPYKVTDIRTRAKIITECKINPWYFLREVVRIPVPGGTKMYELHRGNLALNYLSLNNIDTFSLLPRQHGKTIGSVVLLNWVFWFATQNADIIFMNKKYSDSQLNLKRFISIAECLPKWLIEKKCPKDQESSTTFSRLKNLNNKVTALPAATNPEEADKLGRGLTSPIGFFDEWAFAKYNNIIHAAAAPALSQASIEAEKNGVPHFKIFTTTPNSIDVPEGGFAKDMINNACDWVDELYDLTINELREYIYQHSDNNIVHIEYSWRELGRDEAWYEKQCREMGHDRQKIKREIDLEWTLSADNSPFSEEELERISSFTVPKEHEIQVPILDEGNHKLTLLETPDFNKPVILSLDIGGGLGIDYSVLTVIDIEDFHQIGYFASNRINPIPFARICIQVVKRLYSNCVIVPERNSYGLDVITTLLENDITRGKVFYRIINNPVPIEGVKHKYEYGINTDVASRSIMISNMFLYVAEEPHVFRSRMTDREFKTLERKTNGKIEHADGEHDDHIMSYNIGRYASTFESFKMFKRRACNAAIRARKPALVVDVGKTVIIERERSMEEIIIPGDPKMRKVFDYNKW